jgi:hypothetical protein
MALNITDGQRVTVWKVEDKNSYAVVNMSSSRKDKRIEDVKKQWVNSSWGFSRFVGKAYEKIGELRKGTRIELHGATIALEPYLKDGETQYPKNAQVVVFDFSVLSTSEGGTPSVGMDKPPVVEDEDPDSIPF